MRNKRIRNWYAVFERGCVEPTALVSAFSVGGVQRWLEDSSAHYKIVPAKVWLLVKVMSGEPRFLSGVTNIAPNSWVMVNDGIKYVVAILF